MVEDGGMVTFFVNENIIVGSVLSQHGKRKDMIVMQYCLSDFLFSCTFLYNTKARSRTSDAICIEIGTFIDQDFSAIKNSFFQDM